MPERDANQLAADVRRGIVNEPPMGDSRPYQMDNYLHARRESLAALDELVALVGTLQPKADAYDAARATVKTEGNTRAYYVLRAEATETALADEREARLHYETLVGTLQQERDDQYAIRAQLEVESNANATAARDAQEALAQSYVERREYANLTKAISDRAEAAEAALAEVTTERDRLAEALREFGGKPGGLLRIITEKDNAVAALASSTEELRATTDTLIETNQALATTRQALAWYDDHKRDDGSYDGEMWGDLRALADTGGDTKEPA